MRYFLLALPLMCAPGLSSAQQPMLAGSTSASRLPDDGVRLAPGDVVRINVWRRPELTGDFTVAADGSLSHPLYRNVNVSGVPSTVIEERVRAFLVKFNEDPQFSIEPLVRVAVGGEVKTSNVYNLSPHTTVGQAVEIAGGVTERGHRDDVLLLRDGREYRVDLTKPSVGGAGMLVRSGDEILVRRHKDMFREYIVPFAAVAGAVAAILNASQRRHP